MKWKLLVPVATAGLLLAGCVVQSIQPLFAERDIVSLSFLTGTWEQKDAGKRIGLWQFSAEGSRYKLTHADEQGHKAIFDVSAGNIGTNLFLDFVLSDTEPHGSLNNFAAVSLIAAHAFARLDRKDGALQLSAMNLEWLEKYLTENPKTVAHLWQDKRPILTAATEDLQKFVAKFARDESAFRNQIELSPVAAPH